jgi:hypothetical protein
VHLDHGDEHDHRGDAEQGRDDEEPVAARVLDGCSCQDGHQLPSQRINPLARCAEAIEPTVPKLPVIVSANNQVRCEPDVTEAVRAIAGSPVMASPVPPRPPD